MRVLITGASGFVGSHLTKEMRAAGHDVVLTSRPPLEGSSDPDVRELDVTHRHALDALLDNDAFDGVVHLAGQASVPLSWSDPAATYETNIIGTSNLLGSLKDRPSCRVVVVGTGQEYGPIDTDHPLAEDAATVPSSPYAISKLAATHIAMMHVREFGSQVMATRSFNHTGPGQGPHYSVGAFCRQIVEIERGERASVLEVGYLGARRDFLDVRDVVVAYRMLLESGAPGEIYNVCSGTGTSIRDILHTLLDIAGLRGDVEIREHPHPRQGDPPVLIGDPSKIKRVVGWTPRIPLEDSLRDTLEWYRSVGTDVRERWKVEAR